MASGSSGNCTLVSEGKTHILIDAGISARRITNGLKELGLTPAELAGIFITHEHSDHIAGLATLLKKYPVPIYATGATGRQNAYRTAGAEEHLRAVVPGRPLELGALELTAFSTPHDAADSVGYTVSDGRRRLAVVTDLGEVTPQVLQAVSGAELALLETNYEPDWLRSGPYPGYLKARILGGRGHLSNGQDSGGSGDPAAGAGPSEQGEQHPRPGARHGMSVAGRCRVSAPEGCDGGSCPPGQSEPGLSGVR